jgi:hypothetical protein
MGRGGSAKRPLSAPLAATLFATSCCAQFAIYPDSLVISTRVRFMAMAAIVQLDLYQRVPHA